MSKTTHEASPSNLARKLRKKLRQIENLERLNRPLAEEESMKVKSKSFIRDQLKDVLEKLGNESYTESSNTSGRCPTEQSLEESQSSTDAFNVREEESDLQRDALPHPDVSSSMAESGDHGHSPKSEVFTQLKSTDSDTPKQDVKVHSKTEPSKLKKNSRATKAGDHLSKRLCQVAALEGHSDIITSLVIVDGRVITASRDTTLKSWDLTTGEEQRTFGGHTETVTCVTAADSTSGRLIDGGFSSDDHLIISASFDCTFKMWSLNTGKLLKSVYTFNPLTKICLFQSSNQLVTGSDGGKLELWSIASGENSFSTLAYDASVSAIVVCDQMIYSSSARGVIKVHQPRENAHLACLFVSDEVKAGDSSSLTPRYIRCMAKAPEGLVFGDDSRNLKLLDWKKGQVRKFPNHASEFSSTDAVSCHESYVFTSSYDLDQGLGYINIRQSKELSYQATLDDGETERIMCLDFCPGPKGSIVLVTGGVDLKLWHILPAGASQTGANESEVIRLEYRQALSVSATDSGTESEDDENDEEEEEESDDGDQEGSRDDQSSTQQSGLLSWCSIL